MSDRGVQQLRDCEHKFRPVPNIPVDASGEAQSMLLMIDRNARPRRYSSLRNTDNNFMADIIVLYCTVLYIIESSICYSKQHGFRGCLSTVTQLIEALHDVPNSIS